MPTLTLVSTGVAYKTPDYTLFEGSVTVGVTNDSSNEIGVIVPVAITRAHVIKFDIRASNMATYYQVTDIHAVVWDLRRSGQYLDWGVAPDRIREVPDIAASPTVMSQWRLTFHPHMNSHIQGGDLISFTVPPCDAHASAATGVYTVGVFVRELR